MALTKKTVYARVSSPAGTWLKNWFDIDYRGYSATLNGGPGECIIRLAKAFDYDGSELREGNDVEIVLKDIDTVASDDPASVRIIYKGYISMIERDLDATAETITVHLLGYYTLLSLDVLRSSATTTLYSNSTSGLVTSSGSQNAADIGHMVRSTIDAFNAVSPGRIYYVASDVPDTGTTATYTFTQKTYREAIDILKDLAPANVYWRVDETGKLTFGTIPTTPSHTFIFGRNVSKVHVEKSLETTRNIALIDNGSGGGLYYHYQDDPSITAYGHRVERIHDYSLAALGALNAAGAKFLAENKDASVKVVATIIDNNAGDYFGTDIEDIAPGDTCRFVGFSSSLSDIFRDNMLITAVHYSLDSVQIEVELVKSGLLEAQQRQGKQINNLNDSNTPATYS
jgi:hypothetical protein